MKYRCVKADSVVNVIRDGGRTYVEDGIANARKRAMKMIHGDRDNAVLIFRESDYKERPWAGYVEKVVLSSKKLNTYGTYTKKGLVALNNDGTPNN